MIYAVSDIHGCYEQYKELLNKTGFSGNDTLYVLGDVLDRGPEPIQILADMAGRYNVIPLIGNHEYMALSVLKSLMKEITEDNYDKVLNQNFMKSYQYWLSSGGQVTLDQFRKLNPDDRAFLLDYLEEFQLYNEFTLNGEKYVLVHADIAGEEKDRPLENCGIEDLIFTQADYSKIYSSSYYLVTGHTPTFKIDMEYAGKIYRKNRHIAIDCGCVWGKDLGMYCFDTGECIYSSAREK
ncbi:hypothetical protein B5F07_07740 [Lachnoclostridium sp. An169]|uniref:metallophosphoesterase n=1 Tax=Lachnoclostridium sp. An169 TaxID=1965569 RepID=UPI000B39C6AF|nr:metallophosphoesterase [Lachnoclostridium sp. An169]OUP84346.1 hypothetical protein B5F07_07740 [Lachnoclostridium sp. An169]HJA66896.1 metallophosphoesterase [Candidatus Mediterraneibacter cottocaccae]